MVSTLLDKKVEHMIKSKSYSSQSFEQDESNNRYAINPVRKFDDFKFEVPQFDQILEKYVSKSSKIVPSKK